MATAMRSAEEWAGQITSNEDITELVRRIQRDAWAAAIEAAAKVAGDYTYSINVNNEIADRIRKLIRGGE